MVPPRARIGVQTENFDGKNDREQFQKLRLMFRNPDNEGTCPVWPDSSVGTIQTPDPASPKRFWSPRADGVFTIQAGVLPDSVQITENN